MRARWDILLSELCGGSADPDAARLANEIEAEVRKLEEALKWIDYHYANQDMSHQTFRVEAAHKARAALEDKQ